MDYVYNLEYIMCVGEGKKINKKSQMQNCNNKIQNKAEGIKYEPFMSTFNKYFLNIVSRILLSLFLQVCPLLITSWQKYLDVQHLQFPGYKCKMIILLVSLASVS